MALKSAAAFSTLAGVVFGSPHTGNLEPRIIAGTPVQAGEFTSLASLQLGSTGQHHCSAALLTADTAVTAAGCVIEPLTPNDTFSVRVGSLDSKNGGFLVPVSSVHAHPDYVFGSRRGNVAIVKLATPIPEDANVSYVTLPEGGSDPADGRIASIAGWGATEWPGSDTREQAHKADIPIVKRKTCTKLNPALDTTINDMELCSGAGKGGAQPCYGDYGGPLYDKKTGTLLGVMSWGQDQCGLIKGVVSGGYISMGFGPVRTWIDFVLDQVASGKI